MGEGGSGAIIGQIKERLIGIKKPCNNAGLFYLL
jgi:hypothetical protein